MKIKAIKPLPVLGLFLLFVVGCSALIRQIHPVVIEKNTVLFDTVLVEKVKTDTIIKKVKVYPVDQLMAALITDKSVLKNTSVKRLHGYTPFEIGMYFLKAHENFSPKEYPDGDYNSKGFGLNLNPDHVKWATKQLGFPCRKRNWTYNEGVKLLYAYYQEKKDLVKEKYPNLNEFQTTALVLHAYNTGNTKSIEGCCGASKGCGRKGKTQLDKDIRKVHNERRKFETALFYQKITLKQIEMYKERAAKINGRWKNS